MSRAASHRPPLWRRIVNAIAHTGFTLVVVAGAAVAVISGADVLSERSAANASETTAPATPVTVERLRAVDGFELNRTFVGQVEAQQSVDLSFELAGKLDEVLVDEGESVVAGQLVARLDTSLIEAEARRLTASKDALQAQLTYAEQTLKRAEALNERGFTSSDRLDQAFATRAELVARLAEVDAQQASVTLRLEKSELYASKTGRITSRSVDGGETLAAGQVILGLVEDANARVRVGLPLDIETADLDKIEVAIGEASFEATIKIIRPDIDPTTRTRTVILAIDADTTVLFGQTARVTLKKHVETAGTWIKTRALKEAERGSWSVLVVDETDVVRRAIVELVHVKDDTVFVRGTFPDGTRIIREGPHRVTPGQRVRVEAEG